jgi:hypothetical protein
LKISAREYATKLSRPFAACAVMAVAVYGIKIFVDPEPQLAALLSALLLCVVGGGLTYSLVLYGLWRFAARPDGAERFCLSRMEQLLARAGLKIRI